MFIAIDFSLIHDNILEYSRSSIYIGNFDGANNNG